MNGNAKNLGNASNQSDEKVTKLFGSPEWYLKGYAANIRIRSETVATLMEGGSCDAILDIGCGDGSLSAPLVPRAKKVVYLDQSAAMLDHVAKKLGNQTNVEISYVNMGFMEADLPKASFDLIICVGVLAYVQDIDAFLARIRSLLKPNGILLLECTDAKHFLARLTRAYVAMTSLLKKKSYQTHPQSASRVIEVAQAHQMRLKNIFRYAYNVPVLSRFVSQPRSYELIRSFYGDILNNKKAALGNQCIFRFQNQSN
jgi:2-polyprenyl-3-methyl-5-hydroxy-6-metoxy-1,4-benzoquinol methylase